MKQILKVKEIQIGLIVGVISFIMIWISRFAHPLDNEMVMHITMITTYLMLVIIASLILTLKYIHTIDNKKIENIALQTYRASLTVGILAMGEGFLAVVAHPPIRGIDILFLSFFLMLFYFLIIDIHIMYSTLMSSKKLRGITE